MNTAALSGALKDDQAFLSRQVVKSMQEAGSSKKKWQKEIKPCSTCGKVPSDSVFSGYLLTVHCAEGCLFGFLFLFLMLEVYGYKTQTKIPACVDLIYFLRERYLKENKHTCTQAK